MSIRYRSALLPLVLLSGLAVSDTRSESEPSWVQTARDSAAHLGQQLMTELQAAMADGGPVRGIEICRLRAPEIAESGSDDDRIVGRTALRVRNPDNAPDAWQRATLEDFRQRMEQGEAAVSIETWTITDVDGHRTGRWMKAIPTQPLCVTCHGDALAPDLRQAIEAAYPADQATGFQTGELRGAFTVDVRLD